MIHVNENCQAFHLLSVIAITGEYPLRKLHLLGNTRMYRNTVRRLCQEQDYVNDYTKEKIKVKALSIAGKGFQRSIRLLKDAKPLLQWIGADEFYDEVYGQYNFSGGDKHRERHFRIAETGAMCKTAGYEYRPFVLPTLRGERTWEERWNDVKYPKRLPEYPAVYTARSLKGLENKELKKTVFTRLTGALFANGQCFALYNLGNEMQKLWENSEIKMRHTLSELNLNNGGTHRAHNAIFLAENGMDAIKSLRYLYNKRKNKHKDYSGTEFFPFVYFIPLSEIGIRLLRFFAVDDWTDILHKSLFYGWDSHFDAPCYRENDGEYYYSFLDSNIARLITFKRKVLKHKLSFSIYCFPHQVSFLQEFFGEKVNLIQISLESVEELLEVDSCFDKQ